MRKIQNKFIEYENVFENLYFYVILNKMKNKQKQWSFVLGFLWNRDVTVPVHPQTTDEQEGSKENHVETRTEIAK